MIDEISTASGSDRVVDEVTASICLLMHTLTATTGWLFWNSVL